MDHHGHASMLPKEAMMNTLECPHPCVSSPFDAVVVVRKNPGKNSIRSMIVQDARIPRWQDAAQHSLHQFMKRPRDIDAS